MARTDSSQLSDKEVRDEDHVVFCPVCASRPRLVISILDARRSKMARVFECRCGEVVWDD
jgi:formate dehydrogenase maturation protein FdhE